VEQDGTLGRWTLFYGLETYEAWNANRTRMDAAESLLEQYRAAWESGDPARMRALYANGAVRVDTLFDVEHATAEEIARYAAEFAGAHPGIAIAPAEAFGDNRRAITNPERVGSSFTIVDGSCTVRMAVILTADAGLITDEEVFWDPDTLLECGWAA